MTPSDLVARALTILVTAIGSTGFVAAVGGAMLYARFDAAQLPADQAVAVASNQELVVMGAVTLASIALPAIAALVFVYLSDFQGTPGGATRLALVVLIVVGLCIAIIGRGFEVLEALAIGAAFIVAGAALLQLLELLAGNLRDRRGHKPDEAVESRVTVAILGTGDLPLRAARGLAVAWLVAGVVVAAQATQPFEVVLWGAIEVLLLGAMALCWGADARVPPILAFALLALGATALVRTEPSLAILAGLAVALGAVNLAIARATQEHFPLYGASVFVSVLVFGAAVIYTTRHDDPQMQSIAVALKDGTTRCGLYVGETDARLYLARVRVVARGRRAAVAPNSGRIVSLPRDQVDSLELGPLQGIVGAQEDAAQLEEELKLERSQRRANQEQATPGATTAQNSVVRVTEANGCVPGSTKPAPRPSPQRNLARRFQPRLVVDRDDGFWPISALTMFDLRRGKRRTCRNVAPGTCVAASRASALPWTGGVGEWLEYPGKDTSVTEQAEDMVEALGSPDPARTAHQYFFVTSDQARGTTSVQYWFFYLFNYQRLGLKGVQIGRAGFHEGDFENVGVVLSADQRPVYVWMARHAPSEGRPFLWSESALAKSGEHATVFVARGSHATYESCTTQKRSQLPKGIINDRPQCDRLRQLTFEPQITPLSDLALAPWVCWQGRFGHASRDKRSGAASAAIADGPLSPLWQQRFGRTFTPCAGVAAPSPSGAAGDEEVLDDATAAALRSRGAVLDGSFDSCADWEKPPSSGVYVVACDQEALTGYFKSGLRDLGDMGVRIGGRQGREERASIPAVLRRPELVSPDGVRLRAAKAMTVRVYAACYAGERAIAVTFPAVALVPGRPLVLRTGQRSWSLEGNGPSSTVALSEGGRCSA